MYLKAFKPIYLREKFAPEPRFEPKSSTLFAEQPRHIPQTIINLKSFRWIPVIQNFHFSLKILHKYPLNKITCWCVSIRCNDHVHSSGSGGHR